MLGFAALLPDASRAQEGSDLIEVFWEFRHERVVETVVTSRYDGERFFISMGDLFGSLQIDVTQVPSNNMVYGFYLQTSRQYELDFNANRASLGNTELSFEDSDYVKDDLGFYLSPALYERLFHMTLTLDERSLSMTLTTSDEMPVIAERRRQATRVIREQTTFLERNAPLLFDRNRSVFTGGVVGYRLSSQLTGTTPAASLDLRGGGELLGGDLEMGVAGRYASGAEGSSDFQFELNSWRWRYVLRNLPALRQAQVGRLRSDGLRSFSYVGARLSNDPAGVQRFFGSYPMRIQSEPGWEVEIYLNSQLIDVRPADANGMVNFAVPITYGSTSVTVREYGPSGEYRESERRVQVPFSFVPPGEIRYNVFAGEGTTTGRKILQAATSVGLTDWLTAKWGFDYVTPDTTRPGEQLANLSWGSLSARLGPSYVISARAAPGAVYEASLNAFWPSLASVSLNYTRFGQNRIYNTAGIEHQSSATVLFPFQLGSMPLNWRTNLSERRLSDTQYTFSAQQELTFQPGVLRVSLGLRGDGSFFDGAYNIGVLRFEPRVGYSFSRSRATFAPVRGLLFSLRSSMDVRSNELLNVSANISRSVGRLLRLQTDVSHQVQRNETSVSLRLALQLNSVRTTTGARLRTASAPTLTQDMSGALSYDIGSRNVNLSDRDWVGRSAATFRMFVDYDGDEKRGDDEPYIENGGINFERNVSTRRDPKGFLIVTNLQPYERYNVRVNISSIRNPFWVPKFEEFSFVTDPNVHKVVDIPFFVTGEITGSVLRQTQAELAAVPGLKLHIEEVDGERSYTESVFSDGTFYKLGVPPGTYRAWVDSTQMGVLDVVSDPAVRNFTVDATEVGDMVDGLDFVLRDPDKPLAVAEAGDQTQAGQTREDQEAPQPEQDRQALPSQQEPPAEPAEQPDAVEPEKVDAAPFQAAVYIIDEGLAGLRELAGMVYGDESLWPKIWLANSDKLELPSDVESGMQLVIPPKAPLTPIERAAGAGYESETQDGEAARPQPQDAPTGEQQGGGEQTDGRRSHIVSPDDVSLMSIAHTYYTNGSLWPKIWVANLDVLPNPDRMEIGTTLVIPPVAPLTENELAAIRAYRAGNLDAVRAPSNADAAGETVGQDQQTDETAPQQQTPRPSNEPQDDAPQNPQQDTEPLNEQQLDETPEDTSRADGPQQGEAADVETTDAAAPAAGEQPPVEEADGRPGADPTEASNEADASTTHRVVPGDMSVMNLARIFYDDASLWPKIWLANRDLLPRPEALAVGMELDIPPKAPLTYEERSALEEYNASR